MAGEIGQAFVRIRPNLSGFKQETESGVGSAFRGIGRVVGTLFAVGGAVAAAKKVIAAGAEQEVALGSVRSAIAATDKRYKIHGQTVASILEKEARDAGFGLGEVAQAFTRLEQGTRSTSKSLDTINAAEDISRARHIGLAQAANVLSRAQQGSTTALSRIGIIIPKINEHVATLTKEHDKLVAAGVKFTKQQDLQYKSSLAQAAALDKQASKTNVLAEVQKRFGGQADSFSKSTSGQLARLRENVTQLEAGIGKDLLPTVNSAVSTFSHWVDELRQSESVHNAVTNGVHTLADAFRIGRSAVEAIAPALRTVAGAAAAIGHVAGLGGILAFVGGFKAVTIAVEAARAVQVKYAQVIAVGSGKQAAVVSGAAREAAAYNALTVALERNTIAQEANLLANSRNAIALEASVLPAAADVAQVYGTIGTNVASSGAQIGAASQQIAAGTQAASSGLLSTAADAGVVADVAGKAAFSLGKTGQAASGLAVGLGAARAGVKGTATEVAGLASVAAVGTSATQRLTRAEADGVVALIGQQVAHDRLHPALKETFRNQDLVTLAQRRSLAATDEQIAASAAWKGTWTQAMLAHGQGAEIGAKGTAALSAELDSAAGAQGRFTAATVAAGAAQAASAGEISGQVAATDRHIAALTADESAQAKSVATTAAQAEAMLASTASIEANSIALGTNAEANVAASAASAIGAGTQAAAGIERTAVAAGTLGSKLSSIGKGLFTLAGGYTTLAAVGIAAAAFGIYKLVTADTALEAENKKLGKSIQELGDGMARAAGDAKAYADAISSIKSDRVALQVAKANLAIAAQAAATSDAKRGSADYLSIQAQLASAQDGVRTATRQLSADEATASKARQARIAEDIANIDRRNAVTEHLIRLEKIAAQPQVIGGGGKGGITTAGAASAATAEERRARAIQNSARAASKYADALAQQALHENNQGVKTRIFLLEGLTRALQHVPTERQIRLVVNAGTAKAAIRSVVTELERAHPNAQRFAADLRTAGIAASLGNAGLSRRVQLLARFAQFVGRLPTQREVNIALNTKSFPKAVGALRAIVAQMIGLSADGGGRGGNAYANAFKAGVANSGLLDFLGSLVGSLNASLSAAGVAAGDVPAGQISKDNAALKSVNAGVAQAQAAVTSAKGAIAGAGQGVANASNGLAQAIKDGAQQVRDAVKQADQNLASIGNTLTDTINQFLDKAGELNPAAALDPKSKEFERLSALAASGDVGAAKAAKEIKNQIEQGDAAAQAGLEKKKEKTGRQINDLVDLFNKGAIGIATFNKRLAKILASDGITYKKAGATLGIAFADGFRAQVKGLREQAGAIAAGPRFKGITGLEPDIVRPLDAVKASQEAIAAAQKGRDGQSLGVAKASKTLLAAEKTLAEKQHEQQQLSNKIQRETEKHTRFLADQAKKEASDKVKAQALARDTQKLIESFLKGGGGKPGAQGAPKARGATGTRR